MLFIHICISRFIGTQYAEYAQLTHWCRVTHMFQDTIIGSDNGLSPGLRQAIIWPKAVILLVRTLGTNFNEILIEIHIFSFKKLHLKMSSAKWRPSCLGLKVLKKKSLRSIESRLYWPVTNLASLTYQAFVNIKVLHLQNSIIHLRKLQCNLAVCVLQDKISSVISKSVRLQLIRIFLKIKCLVFLTRIHYISLDFDSLSGWTFMDGSHINLKPWFRIFKCFEK